MGERRAFIALDWTGDIRWPRKCGGHTTSGWRMPTDRPIARDSGGKQQLLVEAREKEADDGGRWERHQAALRSDGGISLRGAEGKGCRLRDSAACSAQYASRAAGCQ